MKAKKLLEYKLKGERYITARKPLLIGEIIAENKTLYFGDKAGNFYAYDLAQRKNFFGQLKVDAQMR